MFYTRPPSSMNPEASSAQQQPLPLSRRSSSGGSNTFGGAPPGLGPYNSGRRQPRGHAAGVLPYFIHGNRIFFVLGRSRVGGKLSTFTGKRCEYDVEETVVETAAREFTEETLAVMLSRKEALERVQSCPHEHIIKSRSPRGLDCSTFLVQVPFNRHYPSVFERLRDFLESQRLLPWHLSEMQSLVSVTAHTMLTAVRRAWERNGLINTAAHWVPIEKVCALCSGPRFYSSARGPLEFSGSWLGRRQLVAAAEEDDDDEESNCGEPPELRSE